jgi:hypothetical protein
VICRIFQLLRANGVLKSPSSDVPSLPRIYDPEGTHVHQSALSSCWIIETIHSCVFLSPLCERCGGVEVQPMIIGIDREGMGGKDCGSSPGQCPSFFSALVRQVVVTDKRVGSCSSPAEFDRERARSSRVRACHLQGICTRPESSHRVVAAGVRGQSPCLFSGIFAFWLK